jgi:hypothetical protein
MYFLMDHIDFSSAASTNSLQVVYFAFLTILLYSLHLSFHSVQSIWLRVLLCRFLARFSSFLTLVSSSFHHLLLKGDGFFRGVVSAVALLIAFVMSLVNLSISSTDVSVFCSGRGGRYFCSLFFSALQSVLVKLYGGCMGGVVHGVRSSMVSIGRWSEPWSFSVAIWHLIMLLIACSFPHTKSIAFSPPGM